MVKLSLGFRWSMSLGFMVPMLGLAEEKLVSIDASGLTNEIYHSLFYPYHFGYFRGAIKYIL